MNLLLLHLYGHCPLCGLVADAPEIETGEVLCPMCERKLPNDFTVPIKRWLAYRGSHP